MPADRGEDGLSAGRCHRRDGPGHYAREVDVLRCVVSDELAAHGVVQGGAQDCAHHRHRARGAPSPMNAETDALHLVRREPLEADLAELRHDMDPDHVGVAIPG